MGKLAIWILVALAALLIFRVLSLGKIRPRRPDGEASSGGSPPGGASPAGRGAAGERSGADDGARAGERQGELIMACAVCGVHVPASEALYARGRVYCCEAHRDEA